MLIKFGAQVCENILGQGPLFFQRFSSFPKSYPLWLLRAHLHPSFVVYKHENNQCERRNKLKKSVNSNSLSFFILKIEIILKHDLKNLNNQCERRNKLKKTINSNSLSFFILKIEIILKHDLKNLYYWKQNHPTHTQSTLTLPLKNYLKKKKLV
jgi:hypothetical protein